MYWFCCRNSIARPRPASRMRYSYDGGPSIDPLDTSTCRASRSSASAGSITGKRSPRRRPSSVPVRSPERCSVLRTSCSTRSSDSPASASDSGAAGWPRTRTVSSADDAGTVRDAVRPPPGLVIIERSLVFRAEPRSALQQVEEGHDDHRDPEQRLCTHPKFSSGTRRPATPRASLLPPEPLNQHADDPDRARTEHDHVHRRKQAEHEGEDQLHPELRGALLGPLPAHGAAGLGVGAQRLRDAGAEA